MTSTPTTTIHGTADQPVGDATDRITSARRADDYLAERTGWCAGPHHDPARSARCYLHSEHSERTPPPTAVADFVVGLALGRPATTEEPERATTGPGPA